MASGYDVRDYEEDAGISLSLVRDPDGDVYGGGFESGVWLKGYPVFGELFGHWLVNNLQQGYYYSIGMTLRLMPRFRLAPYIGGGGSYNGLTARRERWDMEEPLPRPADRSYWKSHAEAGIRLWLGAHAATFLEAGYRRHWTETGSDYQYDWISIEYGQRF